MSTSAVSDDFDWGSDGDNYGPDRTTHAGESFEAGPSKPNIVSRYVAMGFAEDLVIKAIKDTGKEDEGAILETILTYSEIEKSSPIQKYPPDVPSDSEDDVLSDDFSDTENCGYEKKETSAEEEKLLSLTRMGFNIDDASAAIGRCGLDASLSELADSISAAQVAKEYDDHLDKFGPLIDTNEDKYRVKKRYADGHSCMTKKGRWMDNGVRKQAFRREQQNFIGKRYSDDEDSVNAPKPMIGFSLPNDARIITARKLPEAAVGPPYFYYENVAMTPKGVWQKISRFLYDIQPEFVDSKFFCAANRKRGYIHNLPIQNRFPLLPLQPRTIHEALPLTRKWWPSWDPRTHLNCLQTCVASAKLTDRIRKLVSDSDDPPPLAVQQHVLYHCRKWNLVWVGLNKVAPLEPDEIESLLGFPKNHTRGGGISRTERYRSLGNSFQVDTVAYHLSVLKEIYPNGINVLSLFSGIGGAEVALHRLGIHMKTVFSVEISEINRNILRGWWEQTGQTGTLIDVADIQQLTADYLERIICEYGGMDLVIGGSPCNNLTGSNRVSRDGLEGEHSCLFYDYFRILESVRSIMGNS